MLGGVWLIYFGFGLLSAAMAPLVDPIGRDLGLSHTTIGRDPRRLAAGLYRRRRSLRGLRRPRRAPLVAAARRPGHRRIGRAARRRLRRRHHVRGRRSLRHRRPARLDRRAEGDRAMVRRRRARLRHGRLHHRPLPREHARADADQQRPDAADRRRLAPGPADLFGPRSRRRPRLACAGESSGQSGRRARRAPPRIDAGAARGLRRAAQAPHRSARPRHERRRVLPASRARQLAARDPADRRHGGGYGGALVGRPDRRRHRGRAAHPEAGDAAPALRHPDCALRSALGPAHSC